MANGDDPNIQHEAPQRVPIGVPQTQFLGGAFPGTLPQAPQLAQPQQQIQLPSNEADIGSLITDVTMARMGQGPSAADLAFVQNQAQAAIPGTAIGNLGQQAFFPGANQPINVGTVGGQIIGQQPIFVQSGGLFPSGVVEQRKKNIEDAAKAQAKPPFDAPKGPTVKDPRFQQSLNDTVSRTQDDFIARAQTQFGDDWQIALRSQDTALGREFLNAMDNLDVLARESDQVIDLFAEVDEGLDTGDLFFSDETLALRDQFEQLTGEFDSGNVGNLANFRTELNKLQGSLDLDKFLNDRNLLKTIKGRLVETAGVTDFNEYLQVTQRGQRTFDEDAAQIAADLKRTTFRSSPLTEQDILEHMKSILGQEQTKKVSVSVKRKGSGSEFDLDPGQINVQENKDYRIGDETVKAKNIVTLRSTNKTFNIAGAKAFDETGKEMVLQEGTQNVTPVEFAVPTFRTREGDPFQARTLVVKQKVQVPVLDASGEPIFKTEFDDLGNQVTVAETEEREKTFFVLANPDDATMKTNFPNAFAKFNESTPTIETRVSVEGI